MSSGTELENKSQDGNSNDPASDSVLSESHVEDEFYIADATELPLSMNDTFYLHYYIMFENDSNNCWLNCAIALLANNKTLYCNLKSKSNTFLVKILQKYRNIMMEVNSPVRPLDMPRVESAIGKIKYVQNLALKYLQPLLKCAVGKPDSTFNAVINLIGSDAKAQGIFETSFSRNLECDNCKTVRRRIHKKSVLTLTMVENFDGSHPVSVCACPVCKIPNQKMYLYYQSLPPCLLFHFENGAGEGVLEQMDFRVGERTYYLTGVVTLSNSGTVSHFVTYIRDPDSDRWLTYNDLNFNVATFLNKNPEIDRRTVHMLCFEALDQMGVITNFSEPVSTNNLLYQEAEIPEITLSDGDEESVVQNQPFCSPSKNVSNGIHNNPERDPAQSTSTAVMIEKEKRVLQGPASIEHHVASGGMIEKEKRVLQGPASIEHNVASYGMIEKEKYAMQATTSTEANSASQEKSSCSLAPQVESNKNKKISVSCETPKKEGSDHRLKYTLTEYEERRLNDTVNAYMYGHVFPFFRLKKK